MKTKSSPISKNSCFFLLGIFALLLSSCGTYQNTSYYDRDGIYGYSEPQTRNTSDTPNYSENNQYKDYFGSLQEQPQKDEIFRDVESYSSNNYNEENSNAAQGYTSSYSDWGNSADNVNINVYGNNWNWGWNNYWGWNLGWGWNSWYGPYYGWNFDPWYYPYYGLGLGWGYGYGWNNYYYQPHYHYYQPYTHGIRDYPGRGRTYANTTQGGTRNNDTYVPGTRNYNSGVRNNPVRFNNDAGTRSNNGTTRTIIRNTNPQNDYGTTRTIGRNPNPQNNAPYNNGNTTRSYNNTTRTPTPSRNYNSSPAPTRSYSSPGYSGGSGRSAGGRR